MMSRPSGESEANTVTGSTSAGSLGEQNTRSYPLIVFNLAETTVFVGKKTFFYMFVCVCAHACACVRVCTCTPRHPPSHQNLILGIFPYCLPSYCLRQGLSLNLEFVDLVRLTSLWASGIPHLSTSVTDVCGRTWLL